MAENIRLIDPSELRRNPENPRLIFRQDELDSLESSIAQQGILVPLTVYSSKGKFFLLDGERRWRCALKLGLKRVPAIVQPEPDRLQNIMMMFAIHNARRDWDPLPTALKLEQIEKEYTKRNGRPPREAELAGLASMSRGEIRRLKKLLGLPLAYRDELMAELQKPRSDQRLTVDHVLESTKGAEALRKRGVVDEAEEDALRRSLVDKFKGGVIKNTVAPRKLARIARAVERGEIPQKTAARVVHRLIRDPKYSVDDAFRESVEQADFEHNTQQLAERLIQNLEQHQERGYMPSERFLERLFELERAIRAIRGVR